MPSITLQVGSVALAGTYVGVAFSNASAGAVAFSGHAPVVSTNLRQIAIPAGALVVSGAQGLLAVTVKRQLQVGAVTTTGRVPIVSILGGTVSPSVGPIRLTIGGVEQTRKVQKNSLSLTDDMNARNTLTFTLYDRLGTLHPDVGEDVVLYDQDGVTRLFAGTIEEPEESSYMAQDQAPMFVRVTAVDYNQVADRHIVAESYDNQTFTAIASDIVSSYLAQDGVTVESISSDGPTFTRKTFNYVTAAECLNQLSEDTGYAWWIDYDKKFYFVPRDSLYSPFDVTLDNSTARKLTVKTSRSRYRNRHYVRAGKDLTDPLTESFEGDGTLQTFTVSLPIGTEPTVTLNGSPQTVGIRNVEDETAFDWYWNKDSNEISQRRAAAPISVTDALVVVFRGLYPVLVQAQDDVEVAARAAVEGGSGLYETIEDIPEIDDADTAFDAALAKLRREGRIQQTITVETDMRGLRSGYLLRIDATKHNVSGYYLIQAVRARDVDAQFLRYTATVIDGDAVGGWIAFYQKLMALRRQSVSTDNELLQMLRMHRDDVAAAEAIVTDAATYAKETRVGFALVGLSETGVTP